MLIKRLFFPLLRVALHCRYRRVPESGIGGQMRGERRVLQPAGPLLVQMQTGFPRRRRETMSR